MAAVSDSNAASSLLVGQERMHEVLAVNSSGTRQFHGELIRASAEACQELH
jgi:hypothetical protein